MAFCKLHSIDFYHLLFPNKQSSLSCLYPTNIISVLDIFLSRVSACVDVIDFRNDLSGHGASVWLKTDTHLNQLGEILCAMSIAQKLFGKVLDRDLEFISSQPYVRNRRGDLSIMLGDDGITRVEQETLYKQLWPKHHFCNSLPGGNNGLIDIYINTSAMDDRRVILFGDSFGRGVASCLSYFFSHIKFCRTPFMHAEVIPSYLPDIVLTQSIERYLPSTTLDDERPAFLLFPLIGKYWTKPEGGSHFMQRSMPNFAIRAYTIRTL